MKMHTRLNTLPIWLTGISITALLSACGGGGGDTSTGSLRLAVTDAPACGYDHVYVTVTGVRFHQQADATDNDPGWQTLALGYTPQRIDLLNLTNGLLQELGQTVLPTGTYTQMRLMLAPNTTAPYANAAVPTGGTETALSTPSAQTSGLKLATRFTVAPGQLTDLVLDINACKSIVTAGQSGRLNLKPVMSVFTRAVTGMAVDGYVSNWSPYTSVSLQLNGQVVRSTVPNAQGYFAMPYLPSTGTAYDLVITAPDRITQVLRSVPVLGTDITHVSTVSAPVALSAGTSETLSGGITSGATSFEGDVTVRQAVSGTSQIELASRPVDAVTGTFAYTLGTTALKTASYVAAPALPVWTSYTSSAGQFNVVRVVNGVEVQTQAADLRSGPATVHFTQ